MNFSDEGVIISTNTSIEKTNIVKILSKKHGICSGIVNIRAQNRYDISAGNFVNFNWHARLQEQLGRVQIDVITNYGYQIMFSQKALYAFNSLVSVINAAFYQSQVCMEVCLGLIDFLENIKNDEQFLERYIRFELLILQEAGYGLDLTSCVASGTRDNLVYVSPKSAKAVSQDSGLPYHDKLLPLPHFLTLFPYSTCLVLQEAKDGFNLASYFINKHILNNSKVLEARNIFGNKFLYF